MIQLIKRFSEKQLEWRNDPKLWPYVRQNGPISKEQHDRWVSKALRNEIGEYFGIAATVPSHMVRSHGDTYEVSALEIIGYCGLDKIRDRTAEYSILIGREYQGKGFATEGLQALLKYAFDTLDLEVVWGEIIDGNDGGLKLAKKLGFREEGKLRCRYYKNGKRVGSTVVGILAEEWRDTLRSKTSQTT